VVGSPEALVLAVAAGRSVGRLTRVGVTIHHNAARPRAAART
jgi:hypothetical protein